ncbi:MAG: FAD-binding oxidoreductase [Planctomyces sp.]|nr:FAD-binding oxidoreductase [Planctomyces sp.]
MSRNASQQKNRPNSANPPVAVIGQGVIGLTSAVRLLQTGCQVVIYSQDEFSATTSMSAGAYWWPHQLYPEDRVRKWAADSLWEYRRLANIEGSGVHFELHRRYCVDPDECTYARDLLDSWTPIDGKALGLNCTDAYEVTLPVIDVPTFMPFLRNQIIQLGGEFRIQRLTTLEELFDTFSLIVNCSGIGARDLAADSTVFPIRGQVVRMTSSKLNHTSIRIYRNGPQFTLILPRTNDVVLGGTSQRDNWDTQPSDEETRQIILSCTEVAPDLSNAQFLDSHVGLRPGRSEVRLDAEYPTAGRTVIHNYGHGGGGFTVAWGCADEVCSLTSRQKEK